MNWAIFVTLWILLSTIARVIRQPKLQKLLGKEDSSVSGAMAGCVLWGAGMIFCLYMAGLYD